MTAINDWYVQFVGGPFDGRTECYEDFNRIPRVAIRASFDDTERNRRRTIASFALYELNERDARYQYVQSLPVTESLRVS